MHPTDRKTQLEIALRPIAEGLGYEFWSLEIVQSRGISVLRIYIELTDRHIMVEDCAKVSRAISDKLDEIDLIAEDYTLEVSSPGLERPLVTASHFARAVGEEVKVETFLPLDGRKRYRAFLTAVTGDEVTLEFERKSVQLRVADIAKAHVVPDFSKPHVPRPGDAKPGELGAHDGPVEGGDVDANEHE